jgi:hypothetical protein
MGFSGGQVGDLSYCGVRNKDYWPPMNAEIAPCGRGSVERGGLPYVDTTVDAARLEARATTCAREFDGRVRAEG